MITHITSKTITVTSATDSGTCLNHIKAQCDFYDLAHLIDFLHRRYSTQPPPMPVIAEIFITIHLRTVSTTCPCYRIIEARFTNQTAVIFKSLSMHEVIIREGLHCVIAFTCSVLYLLYLYNYY